MNRAVFSLNLRRFVAARDERMPMRCCRRATRLCAADSAALVLSMLLLFTQAAWAGATFGEQVVGTLATQTRACSDSTCREVDCLDMRQINPVLFTITPTGGSVSQTLTSPQCHQTFGSAGNCDGDI